MQIKEGRECDFQDFIKRNVEDFYSRGVILYMERWAEMMEAKILNGEKLADIAKSTSYEADTDGVTGFQYGCAVSALSLFWEYGEELRKWHNGEYDYDGDGVVNPAVIKVESCKLDINPTIIGGADR